MKARAKAPLSSGRLAATASTGASPWLICSVTRWATASVSVWVTNLWPLAIKLFAQFAEIFDDAVVHHRQLFGGVGVGVVLGGAAMGGPARVPDADGAVQRLLGKQRFEIAQLALGAPAGQLAVFQRGEPRRIIATIFEPLERVDERTGDRTLAKNADNATHPRIPSQPLQRNKKPESRVRRKSLCMTNLITFVSVISWPPSKPPFSICSH